MLLAILRLIGETLQKTPIEIILQEQKQKMNNITKLLICEINFETGDYILSEEDYDENRISEYLPGFTSGSKHNFSPAIAIKTQLSAREKQFSLLPPDKVLTTSKIDGFEKLTKDSNNLIHKFGIWLSNNVSHLKQDIYDYLKENYLEVNNKGIKIISKKSPKYLFFRFVQDENRFFPGKSEDFRQMYIKIKQNNQKRKSKKNDVDVCCLACGKTQKNMISLKKCSFYDFFSLDQLSFSLNFNNSGTQGMICSKCEAAIRLGYSIANTKLRFSAYRIKISQTKNKYIDHIILPLSNNIAAISDFIKYIEQYRNNSYHNKENKLRKRIVDLNHQLDKLERKKKNELNREIKDIEKKLKNLENAGVFESSKQLGEGYLDLLKEAVKRNISIFDIYFEEVIAGSSKKKVVFDILFGDTFRLKEIVDWLDKTDKEFVHSIKFNFGKAISVFGDRIGKKVLQGLFTGKNLHKRDIYQGAYDNIWKMFRDSIKSDGNDYKYWKNEGPKIFHYTLRLLKNAKLLGEV